MGRLFISFCKLQIIYIRNNTDMPRVTTITFTDELTYSNHSGGFVKTRSQGGVDRLRCAAAADLVDAKRLL